MDILNKNGIATPYDKDGDLFPAILLGFDDIAFPDGRNLSSMIGEIGGSAEWAVAVLPLVWRGGQALGMLTSQSSLTRKDLTPEDKWKERFHYTEDEFMQIQDARFEQKPYFTIKDILEDPFAGGISAFGSITDNYYLPFMDGVKVDHENNTIMVYAMAVNSLGIMEVWQFKFKCFKNVQHTTDLMKSPKMALTNLKGGELEKAIGSMLDDKHAYIRFRMFFNNEYYPALIPVRNKMVVLPRAIEALIERSALNNHDREIIKITQNLAKDWFINYD
jgi:hypothetical protein